MSAALSTIAPRITKLLPLLASDRDGEVVAAVRAIDRTLKAEGLDWHALAAVFAADDGTADAPPTWGSLGVESRIRWLQTVGCSPGLLSEWEYNFVADITARLMDWPYYAPTAKQQAILDRILAHGWLKGVRP
jgi:hypothetical protein